MKDIVTTIFEFSKYFNILKFLTFLNLLRVVVLSVYRRVESKVSEKVQQFNFRYITAKTTFQFENSRSYH